MDFLWDWIFWSRFSFEDVFIGFLLYHQICVLFNATFIIISLNLVCHNYLRIPMLEYLFGTYIIYSINPLHMCLRFKLNFPMTTNLIHLFVRLLILN